MTTVTQNLLSVIGPGTLFMGVGNPGRGDDAAGVALVELISAAFPELCLNAGDAPENHLETVCRRKPDTVIIVDATEMGLPAGSVRLFPVASLGGGAVSSHALSLYTAAEYLRRRCGAHVMVLGIQPARMSYDRGLSKAVGEAVRTTAAQIINHLRGVRPLPTLRG
ncbi:MAG TPA: hydrogenase maturation protease [Kiritimatiellae bacterium]|nr:hydrogenase maturation protease [Kiritimatiellia bacterium]